MLRTEGIFVKHLLGAVVCGVVLGLGAQAHSIECLPHLMRRRYTTWGQSLGHSLLYFPCVVQWLGHNGCSVFIERLDE